MAGGVVCGSGIILFTLITVANGLRYHHEGQNVITCTKRPNDHREETTYGENHGLK